MEEPRMGRRTLGVAALLALAVAAVAVAPAAGAPAPAKRVKTDVGVTSRPCPDAVNPRRGCIYLGTLSDLTVGPFVALAKPITEAQAAFWRRVNRAGGIGGRYEVDVTRYVRDNQYNPQVQAQQYQQIRGRIAAMAQSLGTPTTLATLDQMKKDHVVAAPASFWSGWNFQTAVLDSAANYCFEAMNGVDYAVDQLGAKKVLSVHYPGDYGDDAAAGVRQAAQARNISFAEASTAPNNVAGNQRGAIAAILRERPDLVMISTGPTEMAEIVGGAVAQGFRGRFIGSGPTWNPGVLESAAAPAIERSFMLAAPFQPFGANTAGHRAMRAALPNATPNDGYTAGWMWSYPTRAVLERALRNGDLTRAGIFRAATQVRTVNYEGMLPSRAGRFVGAPNTVAFRESVLTKVDRGVPGGLSVVQSFTAGPTAKGYAFNRPCS